MQVIARQASASQSTRQGQTGLVLRLEAGLAPTGPNLPNVDRLLQEDRVGNAIAQDLAASFTVRTVQRVVVGAAAAAGKRGVLLHGGCATALLPRRRRPGGDAW